MTEMQMNATAHILLEEELYLIENTLNSLLIATRSSYHFFWISLEIKLAIDRHPSLEYDNYLAEISMYSL